MKDKRREKRENQREDEREDERDQEKLKRDRDERKDVFSRKMFENPQTRQMNKLNMFRKNPSRTNYSSFFLRKFILPCFELFTWFEFVFSGRRDYFRGHFGRHGNCVRGPKAHSTIDYFLAGDTGDSRHST